MRERENSAKGNERKGESKKVSKSAIRDNKKCKQLVIKKLNKME